MQTEIKDALKGTRAGVKANEILRKCVHCGFCSATCPTYQILGDERDSPRGRIYLIKTLLESEGDTNTAQIHLDRCLTCRACETTCPSGVEYGRLLDIGREQLALNSSALSLYQRCYRFGLRKVLTSRSSLAICLFIARLLKSILPQAYQAKIPGRMENNKVQPKQSHVRKVILFQGCVQPALTPNTNRQTEQLLDKLGIETITVSNEQCCGALSHHLSATDEAKVFIRKNIDAWWPFIESGIEAIINTASGCGVMLKDYGYLMEDDSQYAEMAKQVSDLSMDVVEYLERQNLDQIQVLASMKGKKIAYHPPCTLQHGQKITGRIEFILKRLGVELVSFPDTHLCCGSAGAYSLLQTEISKQLQKKKMEAIQSAKPDVIVTANIGCQLHLQEASDVPVKHWVELLNDSH